MCVCVDVFFFFFKQKTAYEMRISDWSSDVCSSDLRDTCRKGIITRNDGMITPGWSDGKGDGVMIDQDIIDGGMGASTVHARPLAALRGPIAKGGASPLLLIGPRGDWSDMARSEEHTSELQSLMRISYAVVCLTKKNSNTNASN